MNRRYDLDWLRVIAFALLILFHTGMMFSPWNWSVKNLETSEGLGAVMGFLHEWRMPLLFFISGSAVWLAMDRYSTWKFFLERHKRLLLPLVFGMLVVIPPQVYCERLYFNRQFDSFWDYYRTLFTAGPYPEGNLSWHHLWYVPYIFVYSLIMLPFFIAVRSDLGRRALASVHGWLEKTWPLFLIFLPSALSDILLRPYWRSDQMNLFSDWGNFSHKLTFFVIGFLIVSAVSVYDKLAVHRRKFLVAGIAAMCVLQPLAHSNLHFSWFTERHYYALSNFNIWMWILTALGHGRHYLNRNHPLLKYATDAVYPFYILHQTITVMLAYALVYVNLSWPVKFLLVAAGTFGGCWLIYETAVKPWNLIRICFGMKWKSKADSEHSYQTGEKRSTSTILGTASICIALLMTISTSGCSSHESKLVVETIKAQSLAGNSFGITDEQHLAVYLPPSYSSSNKRFPVLYFLPNFDTPLWRYTGGNFQGFRLRDAMDRQIAAGAAREMIVVIPNASHSFGSSWYRNSGLTGNWEDYIVKDVIAYVDSHYRTINAPGGRGISGNGMGGAGALELAMKHPDVFGSVYAMSPAVFDQGGLEDSGLAKKDLIDLWQKKFQEWSKLDAMSQQRAFRDFIHARINSFSRNRSYGGLALTYALAVGSDPGCPFPHIILPVTGSTNRTEVLSRYENGLGGWTQKIAGYKNRGAVLRQITIEYGKDDEFQWIRHGAEHVSELMRSAGITNSLVVSEGGHDSTLGKRLETAMLPAMSKTLQPE